MEESFQSKQFLIFQLMGEYFAFNSEAVNEIVKTPIITPLPKSREFISGVINLRGELIPAVDLRLRFGMPFREDTKDTVFVRIDIIDHNNFYGIGVRVDKVIDVEEFKAGEEIYVPESGTLVPHKYLKEAFSYNGDVVFVLKETLLFSLAELGFI